MNYSTNIRQNRQVYTGTKRQEAQLKSPSPKKIAHNDVSFTGSKIKRVGKVKKAAGIGAILAIAMNFSHCSKIVKPPEYSLNKIEKQANDVLHDFKFEKADLVYDINNILRGEKLSKNSVELYMETVSSAKPRVYMSEDAGQMMDVLAIAANSESNKELVTPVKLKPLLTKTLQYDKGSILNDLPDTISGDGEPWDYVAASILAKKHPEILDHMPKAEQDKLANKSFWEGVEDDVKGIFGKGEQQKQYLGDIMEQRDKDYEMNILSNDDNWPWIPSDNKWFGPAAVGYTLRGNLNNLKEMKPAEIEAFRDNYIKNRENQIKFSQNSDYREKVISSYIYGYLKEAIEENTGKVNSGLSALALKEAGLLDNTMSRKLLRQVSEEVSRLHILTNETQKLDSAIKTYTIASDGKYGLIAPETRAAMRKFEVQHPTSTATSVFKLAEDSYLRDLNTEISKHDKLQTNAYNEVSKNDKSKDLKAIESTSKKLMDFDSNILTSVNHEIEVENLADPKGDRIKSLKDMQYNLNRQVSQLKSNIDKAGTKTNITQENLKAPHKSFIDFDGIKDGCNKKIEEAKDFVNNSVKQSIKSFIFDKKDN